MIRLLFAVCALTGFAISPLLALEPPGLQPVIVSLKFAEFVPEGNLDDAQVSEQRAQIALRQQAVAARVFQGEAFGVRMYKTIPAMSLRATPELLTRLLADADVLGVANDELRSPGLYTSASMIRAPETWNAGFSGQGQVIAIVDTGVDSTHPFLQGKVIHEACFSSNQFGGLSLCPNGQTTMTGPGSAAPCPSSFGNPCAHGTHVAGIVAGNGSTAGQSFSGIAKDAQIAAVQVFRQVNGEIKAANSDVLAALEWVHMLKRDQGVPIASVNASLAGCCFFSRSDCDQLALGEFRRLVENLASVDVAVVSISGNDGRTDGANGIPLCQTGVTIVGATTNSTSPTIASFSNSSSMVDFVAPGSSIWSSVRNGGYGSFAGTSQAAPHVAAAYAVLRQRSPKAPLFTLTNALAESAASIFDSRNGLSFRFIDLKGALDRADITPPTAPGNFSAHIAAGHTVQLSWRPSTDDRQLRHYVVQRRSHIANPWTALTPTTATTYSASIEASSAAHYRVVAVDMYGNEATSVTRAVVDLADAPVTPSTTIAGVHVKTLREAVRKLQASAGLVSTFTDPNDDALAGLRVKAVHLSELRSFLTQALSAIGVPPFPSFTDPQIVPGSTIVRAVHFEELRERMR